MKIYGNPMSTCTRKVLTVFAEKGVKPEFVTVELNGEHKQEPHLSRQPFGQVPALEDDGFALFESRAMCRYVDQQLPGARLVPADAKAAATVEQWISVESANFTPHAMKIIYGALLEPMRGLPVNTAKIEEGRKALETTLGIMEKQLQKNPFIAGSEFTLADICYMPYIEYLYACKNGDIIDAHPAVAKWWKGVSDRKSWQIATGKAN